MGVNDLTIKQMKAFLKSIGVSYSFSSKELYIERIKMFYNMLNFPWREDQEEVIDSFFEHEKNIVINGIFGCGKTTLLFGLLIKSIVEKRYVPDDILFISFNICIMNELKRKLRQYGFKSRITVRTFDSIIYEICKLNDYGYMDLPNFDGKRRFCYELDESAVKPAFQPKIIFIDEVQDLENKTNLIFKKFFPNARIVFAGDVFQSIQKEPRESLLWYLLQQKDNIEHFYMKITPRVPQNVLLGLQQTLKGYYPEFSEEIDNWRSTNFTSDAKVEWNRFYSYGNLYDICTNYIEDHGEENCMILTFSSAITVKGAMGDVARFRKFLVSQGYDLNQNHKRLEEDKLFLSTANSSKGLERDHVLAILTFPLERAFINFSDDLVMNLITVAITRAKKSVSFYIPAYEDKFSKVLDNFKECPKPNKKKIREGKTMKDFTWSDYLNIEHSPTELIKQSIILYDTRIAIKEYIKRYEVITLFDSQIKAKRPIMVAEEDRAAIGILIENLITSTWSNQWPLIDGIEMLRNHPMYFHIFAKIEKNYKRYIDFTKKNKLSMIEVQFQGIYLYTQLHVSIYNKIYISFGEEIINNIIQYWRELKSKIIGLKPKATKMMIQPNLRMPWLGGIADVIFQTKDDTNDEVNVWELKASIDPNWKDNALTQAFLYALMTGKTWSRISLLNPFRNEKVSYHFNSKNIMTLRNMVYRDMLAWNFNCYLAKNFNSKNKRVLPIKDTLFVYLNCIVDKCQGCGQKAILSSLNGCHHLLCDKCCQKEECFCGEKIEEFKDKPIVQMTVMEIVSPTKCHIHANEYYYVEFSDKIKKRQYKLINEGFKEMTNFLDKFKTKDIWFASDQKAEGMKDLDEIYDYRSIDLEKTIDYQANPELNYELDFSDGLVKLITIMSLISQEYKFHYH